MCSFLSLPNDVLEYIFSLLLPESPVTFLRVNQTLRAIACNCTTLLDLKSGPRTLNKLTINFIGHFPSLQQLRCGTLNSNAFRLLCSAAPGLTALDANFRHCYVRSVDEPDHLVLPCRPSFSLRSLTARQFRITAGYDTLRALLPVTLVELRLKRDSFDRNTNEAEKWIANHIATVCTGLTTLSLFGQATQQHRGESSIPLLINSLPHLKSFTIAHPLDTFFPGTVTAPLVLQELCVLPHIAGCGNMYPEPMGGFDHVLQRCTTNLRVLNFAPGTFAPNDLHRIGEVCPNLEVFRCHGNMNAAECVQFIEQLPHLKEVEWNFGISVLQLDAIMRSCSQLESLTVREVYCAPTQPRLCPVRTALTLLPRLHTLDLSVIGHNGCPDHQPHFNESTIPCLKQFRCWTVRYDFTETVSETLYPLIQHMPLLEKVSFDDHLPVDMDWLNRCCPRLRTLTLKGTEVVGCSSLQPFLSLHHLVQLLTGVALLMSLFASGYHCGGCVSGSNTQPVRFLARCPVLRSLCIQSYFPPPAFYQHILTSCPRLLSLEICSQEARPSQRTSIDMTNIIVELLTNHQLCRVLLDVALELENTPELKGAILRAGHIQQLQLMLHASVPPETCSQLKQIMCAAFEDDYQPYCTHFDVTYAEDNEEEDHTNPSAS